MEAIAGWAYLVIFVLLVVDCMIPAIPAETSVIAGGALAADGHLHLAAVLVATTAAVFLGDLIAYEAGRRGGRRLLNRWLRHERYARAVASVSRVLDRRGSALVVTGRFAPLGRTTVALVSGYTQFPRRRFLPATAVGALAWSGWTVGVGYLGGNVVGGNPLVAVASGVALSLAVTGISTTIRRRRPRRAVAAQPALAGAAD